MEISQNILGNNMATVLIVEDTHLNQMLLEVMLRRMNHQVIFASDGFEALEKLEKFPVDLIISDINMPNMNGFELLERIRNHAYYHNMPFVMMTASTLQDNYRSAIDQGATAFLNYPFSSFELSEVLDECFSAEIMEPGMGIFNFPWNYYSQ